MKKWTVGELQAMRAASRFMLGFGVLSAAVSIALLCLYLRLPLEEKRGEVHRHDPVYGVLMIVVGLAFAGVGWKLRSSVKRWERETGISAKPSGWMP